MITLVLPWAVLVPDNRKTGLMRGRVLLTSRYRTAKVAATGLFACAWGSRPALNTPVALVARVWFPDARKRDAGNLRKLVTDAMQAAGIVADDAWIHDERWIRAGIDRARPRAEFTITPLEPA